ncbi:MAG: SCP2 sterol-binding domain-containing protein [Candidatus Hermodarchaeota archaeon]
MGLKCNECGKEVETLPLKCAHSINVNYETNQWECYMENCGIISLSEFVCENCCINKKIMESNKVLENLAEKNDEFHQELGYFKKNIVQTKLINSDFKYWVTFGEGEFKCGKGEIEGATIFITSPKKIMNQILLGNIDAYSEFLAGNIKFEGDLQYGVVYFDLLKLGLEISKEKEVLIVE